jgi:serine protease Do
VAHCAQSALGEKILGNESAGERLRWGTLHPAPIGTAAQAGAAWKGAAHFPSPQSTMKAPRLAQLALTATWVGILVTHWPLACAGSGSALSSPVSPQPEPRFFAEPALAVAASTSPGSATSIADIAERVAPSVVSVRSTQHRQTDPQRDMFFRFFGPFGGPREQEPREGLGSGVVVDPQGVVITNHHVIDGADEIKVIAADGKEFDATVVGTDSESDVAVLRLKGEVKGLAALQFGDSTALRVGDVVLAIGNPFGVGQTVTMGIVSAKDRSNLGIVNYADFIQTDAAINPGNSGGALVNMRGELVGINTAIISRSGGYQGIGLAIPASMARPISESLLKTGKVIRGFLGVGIQDLTGDHVAAMNLSVSQGVLVNSVTPGSPADKAGLKPGDVIVTLEGQEMKTSNQFRNRIASAGANKRINLELLRAGKRMPVGLVLDERKASDVTDPKEPAQNGAPASDGISVQPLDPTLRARLEVPNDINGLVVTGIAPDSRAAQSGLNPGDLVVEADGKPVTNAAEFQKARVGAGKKGLPLRVYRNGRWQILVLKN